MFPLDVPYAPIENTPTVLAQTAADANGGPAAAAIEQPFNYLLRVCQEISTEDVPTSAARFIDPLGRIAVYYYQRSKLEPDMSGVSIAVLSAPIHGRITPAILGVDANWPMYRYAPEPGYQGSDQVVFMATYRGKNYKVVVNLLVELIADDNAPQCPAPTLKKLINSIPTPGSVGYNDSGVYLGFSPLADGAVVGTASGTNITLDTNAAGYGWYIDYTPYLNSKAALRGRSHLDSRKAQMSLTPLDPHSHGL